MKFSKKIFRHQRELHRERAASQAFVEGSHLDQQVHGTHRDERRGIFREMEKFEHVSTSVEVDLLMSQ